MNLRHPFSRLRRPEYMFAASAALSTSKHAPLELFSGEAYAVLDLELRKQ